MEIKNFRNIIFYFLLSLSFLKKQIICNNNITCFEYSCEECNSSEYGSCTKCRFGYKLIGGTCPCSDSSCAFCITSVGRNLCRLCKKGYIWDFSNCFCSISNCE